MSTSIEYAIESRVIPVADLRFDVDLCGPVEGPVVLMLHGFPQSKWSWRRQMPVLAAAGYRCVAPNQRGYSAGARPLDPAQYAADLIVADALGLVDALGAQSFHLVGHDWGGQIAWMTAVAAPQRIISLAILSRPHPAAFVKALAEDPKQAARSGHHKSLLEPATPAAIRADNMARFRLMFAAQGVGPEDADAYCATVRPAGALEATIEWYRSSAGAMRNRDFPAVAADTLYLWGDADSSVGPMAAQGTAAHVSGPYRFVAIPGAGHFLTDQVPDVVNRELLAHLRAR